MLHKTPFEWVFILLVALCTFGVLIITYDSNTIASELKAQILRTNNLRTIKQQLLHTKCANHDVKCIKSASDSDTNPDQKQLVYHSKETIFIHSGIELKYFNEVKQYGLVATSKIPHGTIISVEKPMVVIPSTSNYNDRDEIVNLEAMMYSVTNTIQKALDKNPEFKHIWNNELKANPEILSKFMNMMLSYGRSIRSGQALTDWAKFNTYWYGGINMQKPLAIYSILSRINFGLPQNVMTIFSDNDDYICILIAADDIESGEELVLQYGLNLHKKQALSVRQRSSRTYRGSEFGFVENEYMLQITKDLSSKSISKSDKREIIDTRLYLNGYIGKQYGEEFKMVAGCDDMMLSEKDCQIKKEVNRSIASGDIFKVVRGEMEPELWTGHEFVNQFNQYMI